MAFVQRNVKRHVVCEFDRNHLARLATRFDFSDSAEHADAVLQVNEIIAFDEFRKIEKLIDLCPFDRRPTSARGAVTAVAAKNFAVGCDDNSAAPRCGRPGKRRFFLVENDPKTFGEMSSEKNRLELGYKFVFRKDFLESFLFALVVGDEIDLVFLLLPARELTEKIESRLLLGKKPVFADLVGFRKRTIVLQRLGCIADANRVGAKEQSAQIKIGKPQPAVVGFLAKALQSEIGRASCRERG